MMGESHRFAQAFGINVYNLMIKVAFYSVGAAQTNLHRLHFFNNVQFNVGGLLYSLSDWEHGFLRGNKKAPFTLRLPFGERDTRLAFVVQNPDARIHFALNCGARSCPPVRFYTSTNLDAELNIVARSFCEDNVQIRDDGVLHLSKIFGWYASDFGGKSQLSQAVLPYLTQTKSQQLEQRKQGKIKIQYIPYDWTTAFPNVTQVYHPDRVKANTTRLLFPKRRPRKSVPNTKLLHHMESEPIADNESNKGPILRRLLSL